MILRQAPIRSLLFVALLTASIGALPNSLARGDAAWERRADGAVEGRPQLGPVQEAIEAFEAAAQQAPMSLEARWKLLRALHFQGQFVITDKEEQRAIFDRARALAEQSLSLAGRSAGESRPLHELESDALVAALDASGVSRAHVGRLYFWSAIHWGAWARSVGLLGAVRQGVANRLFEYTRATIALDPDYEAGAAYRLMGRLHAELPRVPFISGWVNRDAAIPLVEQALAVDPTDPGNRLLLALTLLELAPERRDETLVLLDEVARSEPRPERHIEDLAVRREALQALDRSRS